MQLSAADIVRQHTRHSNAATQTSAFLPVYAGSCKSCSHLVRAHVVVDVLDAGLARAHVAAPAMKMHGTRRLPEGVHQVASCTCEGARHGSFTVAWFGNEAIKNGSWLVSLQAGSVKAGRAFNTLRCSTGHTHYRRCACDEKNDYFTHLTSRCATRCSANPLANT